MIFFLKIIFNYLFYWGDKKIYKTFLKIYSFIKGKIFLFFDPIFLIIKLSYFRDNSVIFLKSSNR